MRKKSTVYLTRKIKYGILDAEKKYGILDAEKVLQRRQQHVVQ